MALDGINPSQKAAHTELQWTKVGQTPKTTDFFTSTIREGKKSASNQFTEYFWKGWEYVKYPFVKGWEWIKWVVYCCPGEKTQIEIMESIVADPKAAAKEFNENTAECAAELAMAALTTPAEVQKLRDDNKGEVGAFMKELKKLGKNNKQLANLFTGNKGGLVQALKAFINPIEHSGHDMFKRLAKLTGKNAATVAAALGELAEEVLTVLGKEDKEQDSDQVKALRLVFKSYIPKVVKHAQEKPEEFKEFFKELYKLRSIDGNAIVALFQRYLHPAPDGYELSALRAIFANEALVLRQLAEPRHLGEEYDGSTPIRLQMAFYKCLLKEMDAEQIGEVIQSIGGDFPLVTGILQLGKDRAGEVLKKIAENLVEGLEVLQQLKADYNNPPKADKK